MALLKRGNVWWIDLRAPDGTRIRETTKTDNKQLAARYESKRKQELFEYHQMGITPDRPLKEAVSHFLKLKRRENLRTVAGYEQQLDWWLEELKDVTLQKVDEVKIVNAILKKQETVTHMGTPPSNATLNRYLAALRACLYVAHDLKWIARVPKFVEYDEPKERVRWLSADERIRLLDACPDHWRGMVRLSLATGLRQSNVRALRWKWVDLATKTVTIPGSEFKNGNEFCIPLNEEAMSAIVAETGKHEEFVFTYQGRPITQISHEAWKAVLDKAGIEDFRWHDLRHTWATDMTRRGVPTQALQKLGGWETLAMVNKYAHHDVESLRQWVEPKPVPEPEKAGAQIGHNPGKRHLRLVA